jgi:hypothetical protein
MKTAIACARRHLALTQVFFLAIPASGGWTALPAPRIPAATALLDHRGMESSRLLADDSGALYLYLGDTLYRGQDRGIDWKPVLSVPAVAYGDSERVYRPILIGRGDWLFCNGMLSTDRGENWSEGRPELGSMMWLTLVPGNRFLGSRWYGASLFLSSDTGATAEEVGGRRDGYQQFAEAGDFRYLVAGMHSDMLYSPDGGHTWNPLVVPSGDTVAPITAFALAADPHRAEGTVYALSDSGSGTRLHLIHWRAGGIHVATRPAAPGFPDSAVTCFRAVPIPGGTRLWVGTWGQGLFASDDAGLSWRQSNPGLGDLHVGGLAVSGEDVFALTRDGLYQADLAAGIRRYPPPGIHGAAKRENGSTLLFPGPGRDGRSGARFRIDGKRAAALGRL